MIQSLLITTKGISLDNGCLSVYKTDAADLPFVGILETDEGGQLVLFSCKDEQSAIECFLRDLARLKTNRKWRAS